MNARFWIAFFAWNPQLLRGIETVPRRSRVGLLVLTGLTVYDFIASWSLGIRYQGWPYTVTVAAANGVVLGVCWTLFVLARRQPSFFRNLLFHWTTTVWLVWLAFPWLGESI